MAADDDEGSGGENKNDDPLFSRKGKTFSTMHQEFENKLTKSGLCYEEKVGIVLSGWDHLAGSASNGQIQFATFLYRWTLQLVLQGEWPKLEKIVKTRLGATLQRCTRDPSLKPLCQILLPLVSDPWGHPTLKAIFAKSFVSDEEAEQFINSESWQVIRVRVDTLVESRCEELALAFLKVCWRCIRRLQSKFTDNLYPQEDHNHFFDLYFVLLYKFNKKQFLEEVRQLELMNGVDQVRRLLSEKEKGRVWKHRLKIAELEIQIFLASCIVKPYEEIFWSVFMEWCEVMKAVEVAPDDLSKMVYKYLQLSESSKHIYIMGSIIHQKFGKCCNTLVIELLIRALTLDMNTVEGVKLAAKEGCKDEQVRLEHQMANGFMDLSLIFEQHMSVARECVLTAFSLHPTHERLQKLKQFVLCTIDDRDQTQPSHQVEHSSGQTEMDGIGSIEESPIVRACSSVNTPLPNNQAKGVPWIATQLQDASLNIDQSENAIPLSADVSDSKSFTVQPFENVRNNMDLSPVNPDIKVPIVDTGQKWMNSECRLEMDAAPAQSVGHGKIQIEEDPLEILNSVLITSDGEAENADNVIDMKKSLLKLPGDDEMDMRVKEDVDSMDGFLASTENLIEQLKPQPVQVDLTSDILNSPKEVLNAHELGLSKELCDDLAVVLSCPRWQILSWGLPKDELTSVCEKYISDSESAKNVTKELKYLNIDYDQFKHMPTDEDEHTGIEKGYEHFMEEESDEDDYFYGPLYSSGSDGESWKKNRGVPHRSRRGRTRQRGGRFRNSDSDSAGRCRRAFTSLSESDDSDYEPYLSKCFEGKRVTAVSCNDRGKRLRVDETMGTVKRSKPSHLRLYRHDSSLNQQALDSSKLCFARKRGKPRGNNKQLPNYAPSLGSVNLNPTVVLTPYQQSPARNEVRPFMNLPKAPGMTTNAPVSSVTLTKKLVKAGSGITTSITKLPSTGQSALGNSWRYAGYLVSGPEREKVSNEPLTPVRTSTAANAVKCSYRTREGRVVTLNTQSCYSEGNVSTTPKTDEYIRKLSTPSSKYEESFAKFLMQQSIDSKISKVSNQGIDLKEITFRKNLEYLKRQGTSVIFKKTCSNTTSTLANAQKNVLNRIMSPENAVCGFGLNSSGNRPLPIRAIAMPVSHNPPNLPLNDKSNPVGLSRVLPKGTTVVRRPKSDAGAGPSGISSTATSLASIPISRSLPTMPRPTVSITPSNNFFISSQTQPPSSSFLGPNASTRSTLIHRSDELSMERSMSYNISERNPPLSSATVVGSVSKINLRLASNASSPGEAQGGSFSAPEAISTTTTVGASLPGVIRAPSMLEALLRDRPMTTSSLIIPTSTGSPAPTITTGSISEPIVASSAAVTGTSLAVLAPSEPAGLMANFRGSSDALMAAVSASGISLENSLVGSPLQGMTALHPSEQSTMSSNLLSSALSGGSHQPALSTVGISNTVTVSGSQVSSESPSGMHQLLLPAQLIQVQGSDGSTGLGIVHSGSLDLRLPPGTRVIKSPSSSIRQNVPVTAASTNARPLNVLHNVKIVQNRQIVRTVVVPHSVALQSLASQQGGTQLVTLSQNPAQSNVALETQGASKISSQLQKVFGHNMVPGGLVIRAVRPSPSSDLIRDESQICKPPNPTTIIHHTADASQQKMEKSKETEKAKVVSIVDSQEEGLAERLSRHYLKSALLASTNTQSVGTQTQTTAVKSVTGQLVNQVVMNQLRGITTSSVPIIASVTVASSVPSPLSLGSSNAVSSETLEQLREFESVFEKVSSKSVKESGATTRPTFNTTGVSSEESMIAAQLLSMANETPSVTTASSYVCSIPSASTTTSATLSTGSAATSSVVGTRLTEGTFITIPCTTQTGTLILVNPSVAASSGIVTMAASGVQTTQPPPSASPALSSTSSHSSVASSPSSSSGKSKAKTTKPKITSQSGAGVTTKPKTPPPPKAPPKPTVAKPQVEESDETKARIQAILDQYKQDLANTPQPQPAPRNRKNCPPPKSEGKSSSKKKSSGKKPEGTTSTSPSTSDSSHLQNVALSPTPLAATPSEDSEGSLGGASTSSQLKDEKPKVEDTVPSQILQGVVVSNMKVNSSGTITSLPQGITGGRVLQLIRQGSKVTAITTKQPYQKAKSGLSSSGPPPNVTIQGRFNVNDLMESQLATLLAGGSATINQNSALISKLIQSQHHQSPTVVVQTSGGQGQHIIQQVSLQPVIASTTKAPLQGQIIMGRVSSESGSSIISPTIKTSSVSAIGISPRRTSSPSTPAPDQPFAPAEEDHSSNTQSRISTLSGPLPPFFTLTKQFMVPSSQAASPPASQNIRTTSKLLVDNLPRSQTFVRSETGFGTRSLGLSGKSSGKNVMLAHSAPSSPMVNTADGGIDMSSMSEPSSLESSPSVISCRPSTLNATSELRSNSLDSLKSDLSVEEVQIPPSPATLTKQLQNAYMTEAALSPAVSQSRMSSSSSYSSPNTVQDLAFVENSGGDHGAISPNLGHHSQAYSLVVARSASNNFSNVSAGVPNTSNTIIDNSSLTCLASPSGDVYLDEAGVGLGLDGLGEGRPQSPSLSDLVPAVPLLSWSPRSADSIMGQSPSLNDESLSTHIVLDVHNSEEDSLCDSSTGFPGLFSMEGDGASVSSSEELQSNVVISTSNSIHSLPATASSMFSVASSGRSYFADGRIDLKASHEQDHTISSTRCEHLSIGLSSAISKFEGANLEMKNELKESSDAVEGVSFSSGVLLTEKEEVEDSSIGGKHFHTRNTRKSHQVSKGDTTRRRSQRQIQGSGKRSLKDSLAHNGYEEKTNINKPCDLEEDEEVSNESRLQRRRNSSNVICQQESEQLRENLKPLKLEAKDEPESSPGEDKNVSEEVKSEYEEMVTRQTRGSKRRSDQDLHLEEKRSRSARFRRSEMEEKTENYDDGSLGPIPRVLRGRHVSGTSDSSSNYSLDRVSTPGPQDSPVCSGTSRQRKRRGSPDSSISSRDGSPLTLLLSGPDGSTTSSGGGIHTRRSSSRDHAKKTRCRCCGDQQVSQGGSNRRASGRLSKGSGPSSS